MRASAPVRAAITRPAFPSAQSLARRRHESSHPPALAPPRSPTADSSPLLHRARSFFTLTYNPKLSSVGGCDWQPNGKCPNRAALVRPVLTRSSRGKHFAPACTNRTRAIQPRLLHQVRTPPEPAALATWQTRRPIPTKKVQIFDAPRCTNSSAGWRPTHDPKSPVPFCPGAAVVAQARY